MRIIGNFSESAVLKSSKYMNIRLGLNSFDLLYGVLLETILCSTTI